MAMAGRHPGGSTDQTLTPFTSRSPFRQPERATAIRLLLLRVTHTEIEITAESVRDFRSSRHSGSDAA